MVDELSAAILVGGRSRRMGTNKALLRLDPEGPTVLGTVVRALREITDDVLLVGSVASEFGLSGLRRADDEYPDAGPLGGVCTALRHSVSPHMLVVACDMPFLNPDLLRYMKGIPRNYQVLVPMVGELQPLHAIYGRSCLLLIETEMRAGQRQVTGWFPRANVQIVPESTIRKMDPTLHSCFNMNTPDDFAEAKRLVTAAADPATWNMRKQSSKGH